MGNINNLKPFSPLTDKVADIWVVNLNVSENKVESYRALLSHDEQERANRFKFKKDREKFIVCRGVLRKLAAKYLNRIPKEIIFSYGELGKPEFANETSLKFNVSHSGELAVIGFIKNQNLGIDVELIKRDFDVSNIASTFFSENEINALKAIPKEKKHLAFYRCWTRKEAFIKTDGRGLSIALDSFSVTLDSDEIASVSEVKRDDKEKHEWQLKTFIPKENYRGALAVRGSIDTINMHEWSHE